jgi:hypothetical protein
MRKLWIGSWVACALVFLPLSGAARAGYVTDTLGTAGPGNYALLALSTSDNIHIAGANNQPPLPGGGVAGNVGIADSGATFALSSPAQVTGNLYLAPGARFNNSGTIQGSIFNTGQGPNGTTLSQANTDALNATNTFAHMAPTLSVPGNAINGTTTVNGTAGVNVLNVSDIRLGNGQTLTLNGPAGSQFVVNDSGGITLNSGQIALSGGLTPSDVVFNMTNGGTVSTAGGLNNESVINGLILDTTGKFQLTPGLVNGEIIGGAEIALASGATVVGTPPVVPAPPSVVLLGLGGLVFALVVARSPRHRLATAAA